MSCDDILVVVEKEVQVLEVQIPGPNGGTDIVLDTTPTLGGDLDTGVYGLTVLLVAGEDISLGQVCKIDGFGEAVVASNTVGYLATGQLFVSLANQTLGSTGTFCYQGVADVGGGGIIGAPTYLNANGAISSVPPTTSGTFSRAIGTWLTTTKILFNPANIWVEIA